jgi:DNA polymerase IV
MFPYLTTPPLLNLKHLPPTYILPTRLAPEKLQELQDELRSCNCPLTDTANDASLFIADVNTRKRCELELRKKDIVISAGAGQASIGTTKRTIRVVKLAWLTTSLDKSRVEDLDAYTILCADVEVGRTKTHTPSPRAPPPAEAQQSPQDRKRQEILDRAKEDAAELPQLKRPRHGGTEYRRSEKQKGIDSIVSITKRPPLLRQTTSSFENQKPRLELPEWIQTKVSNSHYLLLSVLPPLTLPEYLLLLPLNPSRVAQ